ncbi:hypothetical protein H072_745 [Dactylellina haptotyla CBS 200.50]|uniref:LysM domain-containing protein n=1 Tax=Dactylellina haptotyla (strain CBS 200.50) TaxID=1284197 RepID=S8CC32_DACHA|nr:hypothetical protein H072_745 [Dactylellina haptotyla CBS 200.50]
MMNLAVFLALAGGLLSNGALAQSSTTTTASPTTTLSTTSITTVSTATTTSPIVCNRDLVFRAVIRAGASGSSFCNTYTMTDATIGQTYPDFITRYRIMTSRISSACTCLSVSPVTSATTCILTLCQDYVNSCGIPYGGCYPACHGIATPTFTAPPCPTTTTSTDITTTTTTTTSSTTESTTSSSTTTSETTSTSTTTTTSETTTTTASTTSTTSTTTESTTSQTSTTDPTSTSSSSTTTTTTTPTTITTTSSTSTTSSTTSISITSICNSVVCEDYINSCGIPYGGCYTSCPGMTRMVFTVPPCPTTTSTTTTITSTSVTITTTTGVATPSPVQAGINAQCNNWAFVRTTDTCASLVSRYSPSSGIGLGNLLLWNPALKNDCSGLQSGFFVCIGIKHPDPVTSGQPRDCNSWAFVRTTDTCSSLVSRYNPSSGITQSNLIKWNPTLNNDCSGLVSGFFLCIAVDATSRTTTTTTTRTTTRATTTRATTTSRATPSPTTPGQPRDCNRWAFVRETDTVGSLVSRYRASSGITSSNLLKWNPTIQYDDLSVVAGFYVCIGTDATSRTTTTRRTTTRYF